MGSVATVNKIIDDQIEKGIAPERIIVGGFSQGSVIALLVTTLKPPNERSLLTSSTSRRVSHQNALSEEPSHCLATYPSGKSYPPSRRKPERKYLSSWPMANEIRW